MVVALKIQNKAELKKNNMVERYILEVKIQAYLNHPNIVKLYGIFDDKDNIYMILEYMESHSLFSLLKKQKDLS